MVEYKLSIGDPKSGKTHKIDLGEPEAKEILGKRIGDKVKGDKIGFPGYEFEITGGSDSSGFPMRKDVMGTARRKILIAKGVGTRHKRKGIRLRRTVAGNTFHRDSVQVNLKVVKAGKQPLGEAPAEESKEKPVQEEKKKESKEDKSESKDEKKDDKKEPKKEDKSDEKKD